MPVPKFAVATRGYNKQQVDKYVSQKKEEYSETLDALRARVAGLEQQLSDALKESEKVRSKENKIAQTLLEVTDYAGQRKEEIDRFAECELQRLALFRDKWTAYVKTAMTDACPQLVQTLDKMADEYRRTVKETLSKELVLGRDPMYGEYLGEKERTKGGKDIPIHIDELLKKLQ